MSRAGGDGEHHRGEAPVRSVVPTEGTDRRPGHGVRLTAGEWAAFVVLTTLGTGPCCDAGPAHRPPGRRRLRLQPDAGGLVRPPGDRRPLDSAGEPPPGAPDDRAGPAHQPPRGPGVEDRRRARTNSCRRAYPRGMDRSPGGAGDLEL